MHQSFMESGIQPPECGREWMSAMPGKEWISAMGVFSCPGQADEEDAPPEVEKIPTTAMRGGGARTWGDIPRPRPSRSDVLDEPPRHTVCCGRSGLQTTSVESAIRAPACGGKQDCMMQ